MFIIGHRGAAGCEPENTLRAVRMGRGCAQYIEVDVRLSREGVPVILHDLTVDRTTNGTGRVSELDLNTLRSLDAGKGERIPTLNEVLSLVKGYCGLVVELKEPKGNGAILDLIGKARDITIWIVSFHQSALREACNELPDIKRGLIFSKPDLAMIRSTTDARADVLFPKFSLVHEEIVKGAHRENLLVVPWTLNHEQEIRSVHQIQADGFVTDYPCWAEKLTKQLQ